MKKSKSSERWLKEHHSDHYVRQSKADGYRSRASYKLLELDNKDRLIKPNSHVVDLGAAPGGWSQVAAEKVGSGGRVLASDILPMEPLDRVEFVQGDFTELEVVDRILALLGDRKADLVISDMAPNMSGIKGVDQVKAMYLVELALDLCRQVLRPGGTFLTKVFMGEGFEQIFTESKRCFDSVKTRKPDSSRARSSEIYLLAKNYHGS